MIILAHRCSCFQATSSSKSNHRHSPSIEDVEDEDTHQRKLRNTPPRNPQNILEPSDDDENNALNRTPHRPKKVRKKSAEDNNSDSEIEVIEAPDEDAEAELGTLNVDLLNIVC